MPDMIWLRFNRSCRLALNRRQSLATAFAMIACRWEQVFNAGGDTSNALSIATHFPMIKLTHWFDYSKVHPRLRLLTVRQAILNSKFNLEHMMRCRK